MKTHRCPLLALALLALGLSLASGCAYVSADPHGTVPRFASRDEAFPEKFMGYGPKPVPTPSLSAASTTPPPCPVTTK